MNQGYKVDEVTLESVSVDGQDVVIEGATPIARDQALYGDSATNLENLPKDEKDNNITYVTTSLDNDGFAFGGSRPVTFTFNTGTIEVDATVSASPLEAGKFDRDPESEEGYTEAK